MVLEEICINLHASKMIVWFSTIALMNQIIVKWHCRISVLWTLDAFYYTWKLYYFDIDLNPLLEVWICFLFVGYQPKGIDVQSFEKIVISDRRSFKDFDASVLQGRTVYSTIQCQNKAGLISSSSSDGVTIYDKPPSMATAVIRTLPLSVTKYSAMAYYQSVTNNMRLVWSGVEERIGVQQYKARQDGSRLINLIMSSDECRN